MSLQPEDDSYDPILERSGGDEVMLSSMNILLNDDPDTLRIMIATDNHLGFAERDPVRGLDSFAAFEEILYLAKHRFNCDMVLLGGDLFHENRPSRQTLHKTIEIIRRYTMGPNPVQIQILSHQEENFRCNSYVNYQDPFHSVDLPIFSIHGNHDDPSRDSGGDLLAALDILAASNLINYFGRQDQVDRVEISPVLIQKGKTKVALYGLGYMRDERLNRMWDGKKVRFLRPEEDDSDINSRKKEHLGMEDGTSHDNGNDEESGGFFNIFSLHQNRDLGRGGKNCVQESMIPEWMDLVIWGHEHECLIEFFESVVGTFRITQPGSSVATSLTTGEAARKKVGILDVNGKNFRMHTVPLTQVRSFVTTELSLREHRAELDPEDPKIEAKVTQLLTEEVGLLISHARQKTSELLEDARAAGSDIAEDSCSLKYTLSKPNEVLVRVRVEHNGFSTLNNQRFGAKFVGEVANPTDILLFHRKKDVKLASSMVKKSVQSATIDDVDRTNMEDLVREALGSSERKLQLLEENELTEAMEDYVEKSVVGAINDKAHGLLKKKQSSLIKGQTETSTVSTPEDSTLLESMMEISQEILERVDLDEELDVPDTSINQSTIDKKRKAPKDGTSSFPVDPSINRLTSRKTTLSTNPASTAKTSIRGRPPGSSKTADVRPKNGQSATMELSDDEGSSPFTGMGVKKQVGRRGRPKRDDLKRATFINNSDDEISEDPVQDDNDDSSVERSEKKQTGRGRKPSAVLPSSRDGRSLSVSSRSKTSTTHSKKSDPKSTATTRRRKSYTDSDDDDDKSPKRRKTRSKNSHDELDVDWGTASTTGSNFR